MEIELMKYQQTLLNNIITTLDKDGRAGLELFTSGGKSLIGLKLIEHYVEKTGKKVMWIAPRAALNNVSSRYIENSEYSDYVECVSLNVLSRLEKILKKKSEYKQYSLIIIDEAHKLMAKNAYEQFQKELEKFNKRIKLFAMTASSYRNLDGIRSLEEITQGGKIYRYNLSDAINEDVANPIIYYGTALEYNKKCYQALETMREKYGEIPYVKYILGHVTNKLKESENDTESKVVEFISSKVKFDAKTGDRHIIFFSRIAELKEQKEMVYNIIRRWYKNNKNISINIIEYHGDMTTRESNKALSEINSPARPNTVDVVLTVDKGTESIHPENIRSIIMFRGTQSIVKFTQMIGRVITLTVNNKQANYVFDFCKSVSLIGANSILVGRRSLDERTEISSDLTPEQLLSEALRIKSQVNSGSFIEVNLDQTIDELNEVFDRLGAMYNMLESAKKVTEFVKDKMDIIDTEFGGNVAKYLMKVAPELGKLYRKLQSAIMYEALNMGDTEAVKQLVNGTIGDRVYLTVKMNGSQESDVKFIQNIENKIEVNKNNEKYIKGLAVQLLTDKLPTATEKFIQQKEGLYDILVNMFTQLTPVELGCTDKYKALLGERALSRLTKELSYEQWVRWRAVYSYIKYLNVNWDDESTLGDVDYATAMAKYVRHKHPEIARYKLSDRSMNLGIKAIKVLEYIVNGTEHTMLPLDENFAIEIMNGVYNNDLYVTELLRCQLIMGANDLNDILRHKLPVSKLIEKLKNEPTEHNLIVLINYMIKRGIDQRTQEAVLKDEAVQSILLNVGKNGDTTLTRYCIAKLSSQNEQMLDVVKRAAKNGLGYGTIIALAFPSEAYEDVIMTINDLEDSCEDTTSTEDEMQVKHMETLKNRYCRGPYATPNILTNIRMNVLPKKICKAERKFIQIMSE